MFSSPHHESDFPVLHERNEAAAYTPLMLRPRRITSPHWLPSAVLFSPVPV
ncbi:hypothetical protein HanXRQr2_Chr09g0397781 [Helianthus annuus]|uniref:Uncharacterized protein n=1 Tax=Helianthus annuus TaxID=4232 RepID=A0A9K3I8B5_HELAN|nr:hypothetical protein HanXRQr2_Chr09g0397781 [Helianthus annuus]KAJ0893947.1 hypothetical protein HanPSC8_Chr09g0383531 [Helianthus annuus]